MTLHINSSASGLDQEAWRQIPEFACRHSCCLPTRPGQTNWTCPVISGACDLSLRGSRTRPRRTTNSPARSPSPETILSKMSSTMRIDWSVGWLLEFYVLATSKVIWLYEDGYWLCALIETFYCCSNYLSQHPYQFESHRNDRMSWAPTSLVRQVMGSKNMVQAFSESNQLIWIPTLSTTYPDVRIKITWKRKIKFGLELISPMG